MTRHAKDGRPLLPLLHEAVELCQEAQENLPRPSRGRPPQYPPWLIAVLIFVAIAHLRKTKCAQWRFIQSHRDLLRRHLALDRLPARSTFMQRYTQCGPLLMRAIELQGRRALREQVTHARVVAVDKSLVPARGPGWPQKARQEGRRPTGVDPQAAWGYSPYDRWVWGYSFEVVVCATAKKQVFPLLASAHPANASEVKTFWPKIAQLPPSVQYVLGDGGYDSNRIGEAVEFTERGRSTGRRFLCPLQTRGKGAVGQTLQRGRRERGRLRRRARYRFYQSRRGQRLYRRRSQTVEPFHQWFKKLFGLEDRAWHRGALNNITALLMANFIYQLLVRYAFSCGLRDGQIAWILDAL